MLWIKLFLIAYKLQIMFSSQLEIIGEILGWFYLLKQLIVNSFIS